MFICYNKGILGGVYKMEKELKRLVAQRYTVRRVRQELEALGYVVNQSDEELIAWMRNLQS